MKSTLVFLLVCSSIITVSGCVWSKWEQILADKSYERPAIDTSAPVTLNEEPASGPLLTPGHYHLKAPKMNDSFLVWVPYDYTPDRSWPVIFSYGGEGGASTWLFQQVTRERGFIIVGMNYTKSRSRRRDREWLSQEKEFFSEALAIVSNRLNVDPGMVFMGGGSRGGYHTSLLGEQVLDRLAGLIILAAGRHTTNPYLPAVKPKAGVVNMPRTTIGAHAREGAGIIHGKPIFIGIGENDKLHNRRAKKAAEVYKLWGADVTFEEWPGIGHSVNMEGGLLDWLKRVSGEASK